MEAIVAPEELTAPTYGWLSPKGKLFIGTPKEIVLSLMPKSYYCGVNPIEVLLFCGFVLLAAPVKRTKPGGVMCQRPITSEQKKVLDHFDKLVEHYPEWLWWWPVQFAQLKKVAY